MHLSAFVTVISFRPVLSIEYFLLLHTCSTRYPSSTLMWQNAFCRSHGLLCASIDEPTFDASPTALAASGVREWGIKKRRKELKKRCFDCCCGVYGTFFYPPRKLAEGRRGLRSPGRKNMRGGVGQKKIHRFTAIAVSLDSGECPSQWRREVFLSWAGH